MLRGSSSYLHTHTHTQGHHERLTGLGDCSTTAGGRGAHAVRDLQSWKLGIEEGSNMGQMFTTDR